MSLDHSDALIVGEEWISEHFFTTDAKKESFTALTLERRKKWDEWAAEGLLTTRSRFTSARSALEKQVVALAPGNESDAGDGSPAWAPLTEDAAEAIHALHRQLLDVLGYTTGEWRLRADGPVTFVGQLTQSEDAGEALAIVEAKPAPSLDDLLTKNAPSLTAPWVLEDGDEVTSVPKALSELMTRPDGPQFALVLAGGWCLVAERERWPEGRYLAVDLQLVCERKDDKRGGEIDRALTCLEGLSLAPDANGAIWWSSTLEQSIKHTVSVSKDLQAGVRRSVEIIANDVVQRRRQKGWEALPQRKAQELARQSLRYLYRILFLLYAEASPELGVVPAGTAEYDAGYGLDRLRDLALTEIHSPQSKRGTHLYDSLQVLFRTVDAGHTPQGEGEDALEFNPLRADLFKPENSNLIDETKLSNEALLAVLKMLLLTKEDGKRQRGFISYVELGINQLGAVYEGLMSYTGFFAETDLYEVAPDGNNEKGSWVVATDEADHLDRKDFVEYTDEMTGERKPVIHPRGSFVYRLSGRDRQRSASYYTPEVLTKFTVGQALEELLDQDGRTTTADEILKLSVCEPALGSGAFAIEAVRQLAEEYLNRKEAELRAEHEASGGTERFVGIDPDERPRELQKVKAYLALHNTYGVDLNATAVELAEVSLWLDTMTPGLAAPWFGLRLRQGNSLVGARRELYLADQLKGKKWLKLAPEPVSLAGLADVLEGKAETGTLPNIGTRIHHFLLPAAGWGSAVEVPKSVRDLVDPEALTALKKWRTSIKAAPTKQQTERLQHLAQRVETLWGIAIRRLMVAERDTSRSLHLWGQTEPTGAGSAGRATREEVEASLHDPNSAYQRLRRVMDAWWALWYWPLTQESVMVDGEPVHPPTLDEWLGALEGILGTVDAHAGAEAVGSAARRQRALKLVDGQIGFGSAATWADLDDVERWDEWEHASRDVGDVVAQYPWLAVCERVAEKQAFFHWELDFGAVFARSDGFDLQVGNPPWVRPRTDVESLLAEGDPWWQLARKPSEAAKAKRRAITLLQPGLPTSVVEGTIETAVFAELLSDPVVYPLLSGQPDLYRAFMCQAWRNRSNAGVSGIIHLESHFTDEKAIPLRREAYRRLRRHWQFINELRLFDIQDQKTYGVNIYAYPRPPYFLNASSLFHPETVAASMKHNGEGMEPGFKYAGRWDIRAHRSRIQRVSPQVLQLWADVLGVDAWASTPMVYTVNSAAIRTLSTLAKAPRAAGASLKFSRGWDESIDRKAGRFAGGWGEAGWPEVILQGPHLYVANPSYKSPNPTMLHQQDWAATDLEVLSVDQLPVTAYKPAGDRGEYDRQYTHWTLPNGDRVSARDYYRVAWRKMAANTGERTLISAIIPPGAGHVSTVRSAIPASASGLELTALSAVLSALLADFSIRSAPKNDIVPSSIERLPMVPLDHPLLNALLVRTLRLNCMTGAYVDLWAECWQDDFAGDAPILERFDERPIGPEWTADTPLRRAVDRRNAQVEIDALVAFMLGVPVEDLCTIYRTQFAVLYGYDQREYTFEANGRLVPNSVLTVWRKMGEPESNDAMAADLRTATHPGSGIDYVYELPFATRDREADFRTAYAEFERRLAALQ